MKFKYIKIPVTPSEAFPQKTLLRPVIGAGFTIDRQEFEYPCLVDSGADFCFFHSQVCESLGLKLKEGSKMSVTGVTGDRFLAYFHNVEVKIGGWKYQIYAGFSKDIGTKLGILGRVGFFDKFKVCFDEEKSELELKPRK